MTRSSLVLACLLVMLVWDSGAAVAGPADPPPACAAVNYAMGMNLGYMMYAYEFALQGNVGPSQDQLAALQRGNQQLSALADSLRGWKADTTTATCPVSHSMEASTLLELALFPPRTPGEAASVFERLTGVSRQIGLALRSTTGVSAGAAAGAVAGAGMGGSQGPIGALAGGALGVILGGSTARAAGNVLAPPRRDPSAEVVGTWKWFNGAIVTVGPGGSLSSSQGFSGSWRCTDRERRLFDFNWTQGPSGPWYDKLTLSADGQTLSGQNQDGTGISASKLR